MDQDLMHLYSQQMRDSALISAEDKLLTTADGSASARSRLCGSKVTFQIKCPNQRLTEIGWQIKACLFGQAVSGVLCQHAISLHITQLESLFDHFQILLKQGYQMPSSLPDDPDFDMKPWQKLNMMLPAHSLKSRHKSAMIPFEALIAATKQANPKK